MKTKSNTKFRCGDSWTDACVSWHRVAIYEFRFLPKKQEIRMRKLKGMRGVPKSEYPDWDDVYFVIEDDGSDSYGILINKVCSSYTLYLLENNLEQAKLLFLAELEEVLDNAKKAVTECKNKIKGLDKACEKFTNEVNVK